MSNLEYTKNALKHFKNPKFIGKIENADAVGQVGNPSCGDTMRVYLKIGEKKNKEKYIRDIKFQTMGCVAAISSSDVVCKLAKGKTLKEALKINKNDILRELGGLPNIKYHCSLLGEEALLKAIENFEKKKL